MTNSAISSTRHNLAGATHVMVARPGKRERRYTLGYALKLARSEHPDTMRVSHPDTKCHVLSRDGETVAIIHSPSYN